MHEELSPSDGSLLTRYMSGDRRGAEVLFGRYQRPLLSYFLRRLGRKDLAEEGLQETFCRLFEQAPRLVEHPRLDAWLFTVARNVSADVYRRRRDRAASFSDLREGGIETGIAGPAAVLPDARLESRELNDLLLRTLRDMPAPEREVFLLRTQSALSFREIAAKAGAPLNTVLSRMHRAMKRVRRAMTRDGWAEPQARGRRS